MSLIRVGLSETKDFAEGYDAIFKKKTEPSAEPPKKDAAAEAAKPGDNPENPFRKAEGIGC